MLALVLAVSAVALVSGANHFAGNRELSARRDTLKALQTARELLLARALAEDNTPGALPCPSPDESGSTVTECAPNTTGVIGRLPWKTLGTTPLLDGDGECLWYALSVPQRNGVPAQCRDDSHDGEALCLSVPATPPINPATVPSLVANGEKVVAVLFAPSRSLSTQTGRGSGSGGCRSGSPDQFLESPGTSGTAVSTTISSPQPGGNDQILVITQQDVMKVVAARFLRRLADSGIAFTDGPLADTRGLTSPSQQAFDLKLLTTQDTPNYAKATGSAACPRTSTLVDGLPSSLNYKHPVSTLCLNDWYTWISFDSSKNLLSISIPPANAGEKTVICSATPGSKEVLCV
ncbi:hypothetical protein Q9Q94_16925 [Uliginosibacterium sp. 31-16]|uniref:hypothetical protein n=1 Tax=Uliginosibacterium sp. 31-16 TaxID=3068315 RepID=UPI00273FE02C|nr:hypothetical protein [Uliginosibacterium sp. 31-16]MDP5241226.1 hypothetical protein [Uliginosibacterium sp. 31-16]